ALAEEMMAIRPDTPIILCTGHSDLIKEDDAKQMGIKAFVTKPISMGEIAGTIREVLDTQD
ncbi:MAG: hybrid sensor histidine kinase/response regulator, partial [Desulfobacterales bacterium]